MINPKGASEALLESIDIILYLKVLGKIKLWLVLAGIFAAIGALAAEARQPAMYQASATIKLSPDAGDTLGQSQAVNIVRSGDMRPDLAGKGLVQLVFRRGPGRTAYMDISGRAPDRQRALRLTSEAALVFLRRARRLDEGARPAGVNRSRISGRPRPPKSIHPAATRRVTLAAAAGILAAATLAAAFVYLERPGAGGAPGTPARRPVQPVAK